MAEALCSCFNRVLTALVARAAVSSASLEGSENGPSLTLRVSGLGSGAVANGRRRDEGCHHHQHHQTSGPHDAAPTHAQHTRQAKSMEVCGAAAAAAAARIQRSPGNSPQAMPSRRDDHGRVIISRTAAFL